ncbi:MAG: MFS transporter [Armatimonadetes bacterium]|nr:MFS transporter [Armatimonadota bacterium]
MSDVAPARRTFFRLPDSLGALRHRDFRLFWVGAFVSFIGTWVQRVGQGWLVYDLTGSAQALGLLTFLGAAPMFFLTPFGGWLADRLNKRAILVATQTVFGLCALVLSAAVWTGSISYWLIVAMAVVIGCAAAIDIPTRQSLIGHVVKVEDLPNAIPLNAATFNTARVVGPGIGGWLLAAFGPGTCYLVNGLSFLAIILAVIMIRSDLRGGSDRSASLKETLFEGMGHVMRNPAFRLLVLMVMSTAVFGFFYLSLLPALAEAKLQAGKQGLGALMTATGVGALIGVAVLAALSRKPYKGWTIAIAMAGFGLSMIALSFAQEQWQALVCLGSIGMCGIGQLAGTNAALQYYSPPNLRGRVISVHVWSLAGLHPFGALLFGWVSEQAGLEVAFRLGGSVVFAVGLSVLLFGRAVKGLR